MSKNQLLRLQRVQNTAARTVTQTKRSDHITPWATPNTCWKAGWLVSWCFEPSQMAYWLRNPHSCAQLHKWHSPLVPSGTTTPISWGKHFWIRSFSTLLHQNCGTVYPLICESIIRWKLLRKPWRPTCSQRIRFAQTVHQRLFVCLFLFVFWKGNQHAVAAWTYPRSTNRHHHHGTVRCSLKATRFVACAARYPQPPPRCVPSDSVSQSATVSIYMMPTLLYLVWLLWIVNKHT